MLMIVSEHYSFSQSNSCGTCSSPCGAACLLPQVPAASSDVTNYFAAYKLAPYVEGDESTTNSFSFTATNSIMNFGLIINSTCGSTNTTSFTWTLYDSNCNVLQTGNSSSKSFTGLMVGQSYTFAFILTVPSNCYHTAYYPYVYPNQPLPLKLSSFNSIQQGNTVELSWTTESELNSRSFTIQRSTDAVHFNDIAIIDGSGTSSARRTYSYTDSLPFSGTAYYRLKQSDYFTSSTSTILEINGTNDAKLATEEGNDADVTSVNFSPVVSVDFQSTESYKFNLSSSMAEINLFQPKQSTVLIFDERGIVVYRADVNGPSELHVPIENKNGIWYACLINENHKELMRAF